MRNNKIFLILFSCFLFLSMAFNGYAQNRPPFYNEIQEFKKEDSAQKPPKNAVLMIGSSSFRLWNDVHDYFPGYTFLNRSFGGSSLPDVIYYYDDVIRPYKTQQILIYCGENDLGPNANGDSVINRFKKLYSMIRKDHKKARITYVSIKPSPSRAHLMPQMVIANEGIRAFLATQKRTDFVDVYRKMLTPEGKPMPDIFLKDQLHMNAKGYAIWQKAISPYLAN